jgi:hypothetical protein
VDVYLECRLRRIQDYVANKELSPREIRDLNEMSDSLWWVTPEIVGSGISPRFRLRRTDER